MCKWVVSGANRIDPCMRWKIEMLNNHLFLNTPVACCCGHGNYPETIVVKNREREIWELNSGIKIPRKKRFYRRDSEGYYFIPEVSSPIPKKSEL